MWESPNSGQTDEAGMTDGKQRATVTSDGPSGDDRILARRLDSARRRAALVLFLETFWRAAIWPVGVAFTFVAFAWLGVFAALGDTPRLILAGAFGLAFLSSFIAFRGLAWPSDTAALDRLEAETALAGRPLHGLTDHLPTSTSDPMAAALWRAHIARLAAAVPRLRAGPPRPDLGRRDTFALRPLVAMALFVGFMAASGQHWSRVKAVFSGPHPIVVEAARLDAWVTPPGYTGKPSMMLTGDRAAAPEADGRYLVPAGSTVAVRMARSTSAPGPAPTVASASAGKTAAIEPKPGATSTVAEYETTLAADGAVTVTSAAEGGHTGDTLATWRFAVTPDAAPAIHLTKAPEAQLTGALKLDYAVSDDFGVTGANAILAPATPATAKPTRSLVPPPDFSLALPQAKGRIGTATTMRDLTQHPWAGAKVKLTLEAHDEAGQTGRSDAVDLVLPAKRLTKPLARAIIEQRRTLALDAESVGQVAGAIDALMIAPERFINDAGHFFGLKMIDRALARATTDDQLRDVMDLMWTVARQIEDGDLSDAEKALREAQENLRQAIEKGADEKEIARLTDELRKAMDRYLSEMAQRQQRSPQTARAPDQNTRVLRKQDLDRMLKRIEDLARTGSKEAAQQLLNQLQQMMENMQAGRSQPRGQDGQDSKTSELLDKLAELMQRQQDLLDRTHKANPNGQPQQRQGQRPGQRGQQGQQQPMTAEQLEQLLKQLEQGQGETQQALRDLMDQMEQQGLGEGDGEGEGQDGQGQGARGKLGEAGEAMGRAGRALGRGRAGEAIGPEGQALDALRQGAQGLVRELSRRQQGGPGQGPGEGQTADAGREDPLGRPRAQEGPDFSDSVKIPGEIDAERARKILEDIRGRLSQQTRPQAELDYLDRLLKPE
jgi:uncharacterized protein (TIGR02302 family)